MRSTLNPLKVRLQLLWVSIFTLLATAASAAPRRILDPEAPRTIWDLLERSLPWFAKILDTLTLPPG